MRVDFILILINALHHVTIECAERMPYFCPIHIPYDIRQIGVQLVHAIRYGARIRSDAVFERSTGVGEIESDFKSLIAYFTRVDDRGRNIPYDGWQRNG